jgi:signal transduction histidine kinase
MGREGGALTSEARGTVPPGGPCDPDPPGPTGGESFWHRYRAGWHVLAAVIAAPVAAVVATDAALPTGRRTVALVALGALAVWYGVAGTRALNHRDERWGLAYLVGAAVAFPFVLNATTAALVLLFAFHSQVFVMLPRLRLMLAAIAVFFLEAAAALFVHRGLSRDTLVGIGLSVGLPTVFALLLGLYIRGIIEQSGQRAGLIDELTRTRVELARERHEAGVRTERERLATEIHDTVAQGFTSILMLAQAARAAVGPDPDRARAQLDLLERTARENLAEARSLVAALTPPDLAGVALADALRRLADRHIRDTGTAVRVTVEPGPADPHIDIAVLRTVQEALTNVRRHAAAADVHIELRRAPGATTVTVTDDGRGFDPDGVTGGYGLAGIRGRAASLGGTSEVRSRPREGTSVRVELPDAAS